MIHLTLHLFLPKKKFKAYKVSGHARSYLEESPSYVTACSKLSLTHAMFPVMTSPLLQKNAAMENSFSLVSQ